MIQHDTTGKTTKTSLRHIRPCYVRQDDEEFGEDGGLKLMSDHYVIVKMKPQLTSTDPKWQLAKLLHPTPDEDAWVVQWCNLARPDQSPRMDGKFVLVWRGEDGEESSEMPYRSCGDQRGRFYSFSYSEGTKNRQKTEGTNERTTPT